ncbi:MAG: FAD-dependent monooxygenase [Rhodoferax sp.]|uniref:FAD-dependent monooxygenase n=1 Tax=Rhodoferax sp. TaxID=50421 RepID=UPI0008B32C37|nr:FAD-dependent monooxygenase [Rhodoferax sp.]MDP2679704.1 FAD-dependent monooxygenase [Rhodoferax sp.]OGB58878.1 MAG: FAD-dependent oxidoreductase [Burkholderiales bacterium RIFOXYD12_FULL_59_19]OGB79897.1 MAG: FAD-dependent oxidoreductase [Burkholderiales bacterium RIFOXYC12_FULL_60_6]
MRKVLIVGGGIGGLSAALACTRAGAEVALFERSAMFSEFGAGIQLSPNVVKILYGWGLQQALAEVVALPDRLQVRSASSGAVLGTLRLGEVMARRYGAPYLTIHRADLHQLLLIALQQQGGAALNLSSTVISFEQTERDVALQLAQDQLVRGDLLVGADGGWSGIRQQLLADGTPQPTGHLAYRALISQARLPVHLRSSQVTAWLGPQMHVVQYPVRGGEWLNVVAIVHGQVQGDMSHWDHSGNAVELQQRLQATCKPLRDLIQAVPDWRLWALSIRPPMRSGREQAGGRVALLGDAAHPMVPYLAQGAGMAIEDAAVLADVLEEGGLFADGPGADSADAASRVPGLLRQYAQQRWQRNARVQATAIRNGNIFHASGLMALARNAAMKIRGEGLMDQPWLYQGA